jgi:hypothetical protein
MPKRRERVRPVRDLTVSEEAPAQPPLDAQRPVPLRTAPEGSSDPADWAEEGVDTERASRYTDDEVMNERRRLEHGDRAARASGDPQSQQGSGTDEESAYSTENDQGAAQPGPARQLDNPRAS